MMRRNILSIAPGGISGLLLLILLGACSVADSDGPTFGSADSVLVRVQPPELALKNETEQTVYTFVVGARIAHVIDWVPTLDGEGIAPGQISRLSFSDIAKEDDEVEGYVYWWHAVTREGARVPGEVHLVRFDF